MNREQKIKKIIGLFKLSSVGMPDLYSYWLKNSPARYDKTEVGFASWIEDADMLSNGRLSEDDKIKIVEGKFNPNILEKIKSWDNLIEILPSGREISNLWKKNVGSNNFADFINFVSSTSANDLSSVKLNLLKRKDSSLESEESGWVNKFKSFFEKEELENKKTTLDSFGDDDFYESVLKGIGAPITDSNMRLLYAWRQAEGGQAKNNPFNTTWNTAGATNYNSAKVKNYNSKEDGIKSTIKTLSLGYYNNVVNLLRESADPVRIAKAIEDSPWGTKHITEVVASYNSGKSPNPPDIRTV